MKNLKKLTKIVVLLLLIASCSKNDTTDFELEQLSVEMNPNMQTFDNGTGFLMPDPDETSEGTKIKIKFSSTATTLTRAEFRTTIGFELGLQSYTICPNDENTELWTVTTIPDSDLASIMVRLSTIVDPTNFGGGDEEDDDVTDFERLFEYEKVSLWFYTTQTCD
jgi:hypothetical protein